MIKKVIITIITLLLILASVSFVIFNLYFYGSLVSEFRIHNDTGSFDSYPYVRWGDITSGKLSNYLRKEDNNGNLLELSEEAIPFISLNSLNDNLIDQIGVNYPTPSNEATLRDDPNKWPFKTVALFKTGVYGTKYLVFIEKLVQNDGSEVFIPLLVSQKMLVNEDGTLSDYYYHLTDVRKNNFLSPVVYFKDSDYCTKVFPNFKNYCKWINLNSNTKNKLENIITSGRINKDIEKIPTIVKLTVLTK